MNSPLCFFFPPIWIRSGGHCQFSINYNPQRSLCRTTEETAGTNKQTSKQAHLPVFRRGALRQKPDDKRPSPGLSAISVGVDGGNGIQHEICQSFLDSARSTSVRWMSANGQNGEWVGWEVEWLVKSLLLIFAFFFACFVGMLRRRWVE